MKNVLLYALMYAIYAINPVVAATHKKCLCDFSSCMGERRTSCARIIKCEGSNLEEFLELRDRGRVLFILDSRRYCIDPMAGYLRGD